MGDDLADEGEDGVAELWAEIAQVMGAAYAQGERVTAITFTQAQADLMDETADLPMWQGLLNGAVVSIGDEGPVATATAAWTDPQPDPNDPPIYTMPQFHLIGAIGHLFGEAEERGERVVEVIVTKPQAAMLENMEGEDFLAELFATRITVAKSGPTVRTERRALH